MRRDGIAWHGMLDDVEFLSRIYDLDSMRSYDHRYQSARGDITVHRISFTDWNDDWVFEDDRFNLTSCSDDEFLKFLCETIHPDVRPQDGEREKLLQLYNRELIPGSYEIIKSESVFGNTEYIPRGISRESISALTEIQEVDYLDTDNVHKQILRMTESVSGDPELAIGTAKEFVETIAKTILKKLDRKVGSDEDLSKLVYSVLDEIKPFDSKIKDEKLEKLVKKTNGVLLTMVGCIGELRNTYGTGHGDEAGHSPLKPFHALLAVNSAATLGLFLIEIYDDFVSR